MCGFCSDTVGLVWLVQPCKQWVQRCCSETNSWICVLEAPWFTARQTLRYWQARAASWASWTDSTSHCPSWAIPLCLYSHLPSHARRNNWSPCISSSCVEQLGHLSFWQLNSVWVCLGKFPTTIHMGSQLSNTIVTKLQRDLFLQVLIASIYYRQNNEWNFIFLHLGVLPNSDQEAWNYIQWCLGTNGFPLQGKYSFCWCILGAKLVVLRVYFLFCTQGLLLWSGDHIGYQVLNTDSCKVSSHPAVLSL